MATDYFGGFDLSTFVEGANTVTANATLHDGNVDIFAPSFPTKIRKQNKWLNANGTDIPSIVRTNTNKTVGVKVSIQVESKSKKFNDEAEALIEEFSKIGVGELTSRHHFNKALRIMSDFDILDGGFIIRHHYNTAWKIPYKYELVGVDMIDISKTEFSYENKRSGSTINGLVRNKWGQITHIWLYKDENKSDSIKIPYDNITYYSDTWISIDQQTAISKLSSMLKTLDFSLQYSEAELASAIESSKAGAYLQSQAYNEVMMVVSEAIKNKIGSNADATAIAKVVDIVKPVMKQLSNLGVKPHGVTPIPSDDNVIFDTSKSDSQYKTLNDNTEMKMSSALGMSDIGVYKKASDANYSSIKATIEMDNITADIRFDDIKNVVIDDILSRLITVGVQIGRISDRVSYFKNPYVYNKFRCLRLNKINIEPAKNAAANKTNIELGVDTKANIIETTYGIKYEDFLLKKQEQDDLEFDIMLKQEVKQALMRKEAFEKAGIDDPLAIVKEEKPTDDKSKKEDKN